MPMELLDKPDQVRNGIWMALLRLYLEASPHRPANLVVISFAFLTMRAQRAHSGGKAVKTSWDLIWHT